MKLHCLPKNKSFKKKIRLGRGNGSGKGTYSGRGCKGQGQRKSSNVRAGFEGGQTPLIKRIPKLKGFKNFNKTSYQVVNLGTINKSDISDVNLSILHEKGLISKKNIPVKILSFGDLTKKIKFDKNLLFSKTAKEKIFKSGSEIK